MINAAQAKEIAEKFLLRMGHIVLKDDISEPQLVQGKWRVSAKSIPVNIGSVIEYFGLDISLKGTVMVTVLSK